MLEFEVSNKTSLEEFIKTWEDRYVKEINSIPLFSNTTNFYLNLTQQKRFSTIFYHIRGHFHDFLWNLGNRAPNLSFKQIILSNIAEEFSIKGRSHELLYKDFAQALNVDIDEEIVTEKTYLPFAKEFNKNHLEWLNNHTWSSCFSAFSAYEKLDNIDYANLYRLAKTFNLSKKNLAFFSVHMHVKHFDATFCALNEMWKLNPQEVIEAFDFIAKNQIAMWKNLSNEIFNYAPNKNL